MHENTVLHFPQSGYGKTSFRMALSTFLSALLAYSEQRDFSTLKTKYQRDQVIPYRNYNLLAIVFSDIHHLYTLEVLWRGRRYT